MDSLIRRLLRESIPKGAVIEASFYRFEAPFEKIEVLFYGGLQGDSPPSPTPRYALVRIVHKV